MFLSSCQFVFKSNLGCNGTTWLVPGPALACTYEHTSALSGVSLGQADTVGGGGTLTGTSSRAIYRTVEVVNVTER